MIVAAHQPQYLPWLGYFDKIDRADVFVLLDDVQFKKNEWQNRNRIKTAQGWQWLTVPVLYKYPQRIAEVAINNTVKWQHKHSQAILTNYRKAPFYEFLDTVFQEAFSSSWSFISELNTVLVMGLVKVLGIQTPLHLSSDLGNLPEDPDKRLIAVIKHFGGHAYLAGNGGREYMDLQKYRNHQIEVIFQDFEHPVYDQLFGEFVPNLSVIDLILNHGERSLSILRGHE